MQGRDWIEGRLRGFADVAAVTAALQVGLAERLPARIGDTGLGQRPAEALLGLLAVEGLVRCDAGTWSLTADGAAVFAAGRALLPLFASAGPGWLRLADALEGAPLALGPFPAWAGPAADPFPERTTAQAEALADALPMRPGETLLDLGCGTGRNALALVRRWPGSRAILVDRAPVLADALSRAEGLPIEGLAAEIDQVAVRGEVVLLANVLHSYGATEARRLVAAAASRVAPGGRLVVRDLDPAGRTGAEFALYMALFSPVGTAWPEEALLGWMSDAGLPGRRVPLEGALLCVSG